MMMMMMMMSGQESRDLIEGQPTSRCSCSSMTLPNMDKSNTCELIEVSR